MTRSRRASLALSLDAASGVPLHEQIYQKVCAAIRAGGLRAGERMPSVRSLSADLSVSHTTVEQAYLELVTEGYLRAVRRSGYVVEEIDTSFFLDERSDVREDVRNAVAGVSSMGLVGEELVGRTARYDFSYVNLRPGSFPLRAWQRASSDICLGMDGQLTRYGYHGDVHELQVEIACYLRQARGVVCEPEQVILEPGSQAAVSELLQLFDPSTDVLGVEEPGWQVPRTVAERQGWRTVPLGVGQSRPTLLEDIAKGSPTVAFLTPSHQFPTGAVMPLSLRVGVLEWARDAGAWIVEDDSCSEYRYDMRPVPSLQSLDTHQRTIYMGNFSKTLSPALRVAYLVLPPELLRSYLRMFPSAHPGVSAFDAEVLARLMSDGTYERHVRRMVADNRRAHDELLGCLERRLCGVVEIGGKHSGMHLYVRVRNGMTTAELVSSALAHDAKVYSTERFWFSRPADEGVVMVGFSAMALDEIVPGVEALASAWL